MSSVPIPLSKLRIDPQNVRHPKDGDLAAHVHDLQASLLEHGQLAPLTVRALKKPRGHFQVLAGGRRLVAFQGLAADGRIEKEREIDCIVRDVDDATAKELSAAENLVRVDLKPTEEFQLFAELADAGADEEEIARRFGIEVMQVRQRQRLGRLHPEIFDALDADRITLDLAKAYASTEDRALQVRVFRELATGFNHYPHNVRNAIRGGAAGVDTDRMLKVVGTQAYLDAGGKLEADLFTDHVRVVHRGTLEELYYAKVAEQEKALQATLPAEVAVVTSSASIGQPVFAGVDIDDQARDRLTAIDARCDEIHERLEQLADVAVVGEDDAVADALLVADRPEDQAKVDALREELGRLQDEGEAIHAAAKPALPEGPVVALAEPGPAGMRVKGYYRPAGWKEDGATAAAAPEANHVDPSARARLDHGLTQDGVQVMRSHRRMILRAMMIADGPTARSIARDWLVFAAARVALQGRLSLQERDYRQEYAHTVGSSATFTVSGDPIGANEVVEQPGGERWNAVADAHAHAPWMLEKDLQRGFARFLELDEGERELAGAVVAGLMLERSLRAPGFSNALLDQTAFAIGLHYDAEIRRSWFRLDAAFFDWLPKVKKLDAVAEISPKAAKQIGRLPGPDISAACARFFAGDEAAEREFAIGPKEAQFARAWMPRFLRWDEAPPAIDEARSATRAADVADTLRARIAEVADMEPRPAVIVIAGRPWYHETQSAYASHPPGSDANSTMRYQWVEALLATARPGDAIDTHADIAAYEATLEPVS